MPRVTPRDRKTAWSFQEDHENVPRHPEAVEQIRWEDLKDRIDVVAIARDLMGEPPGRGGERGRRSWWHCPLHEDRNPSFAVDPERRTWKCFGCGEHGDAPELVMRLRGVGFREAVAYLAGVSNLPASKPIAKTPTRKPEPVVDPDALSHDEAVAIAEASEARLWSTEGVEALAYLRGRGLTDQTIRRFRLGWTPRLSRVAWSPSGITIPWQRGQHLVILKIRCDQSFVEQFPEHRRPPRYLEAYRSPFASDRDDPPCFPGLDIIEPGLPLAVVEGELDALLLAQELEDMAVVLTLGGASNRPGPSTLSGITPAWPRFACQDADDAGDKAAAAWPASFRRVRPPGPHKDWSDAHAHGVNLRRWWSEILNGVERPALYSWDELSRVNGGGGIVVDRIPTREELLATMTAALDGSDPYQAAERDAIRSVEA